MFSSNPVLKTVHCVPQLHHQIALYVQKAISESIMLLKGILDACLLHVKRDSSIMRVMVSATSVAKVAVNAMRKKDAYNVKTTIMIRTMLIRL